MHLRRTWPLAGLLLTLLTTATVALGSAGEHSAGLPFVSIDVKKPAVEIEASVVFNHGPLELLLCSAGTKEHESILATRAKPSHIHAALLAVGLSAGRGGHWTCADSRPPRYLPPAGAGLEIHLRYEDADGDTHTVPAGRWVRPLQRQSSPRRLDWVFVGSSALSAGGYPADRSGEIVSVANFPHSVIDVAFASSTESAELAFATRTTAIPPIGTAVTVILAPAPGAYRDPVARAEFDIDRFGRYLLDGLAIRPDQVGPWARAFAAAHAEPYIVVRQAGRTLPTDRHRLWTRLAAIPNADIELAPIASAAGPTGRSCRMDRLASAVHTARTHLQRIPMAMKNLRTTQTTLDRMAVQLRLGQQHLAQGLAAYRRAPAREETR